MISTIAGALITEWAGISTIDRRLRNATSNCNWEGLDLLILGGHVIFMLVISVPAVFLIPNVAQDANLLEKPELVPVRVEDDLMDDDIGDTSDILLI